MTAFQKVLVSIVLGISWIAIIVATVYHPELALPLAPIINMIQVGLGGLVGFHLGDNNQPPSPPLAPVTPAVTTAP